MSRQWITVIAIVALLAGGTVWLIRAGRGMQPVEVGSRSPNWTATDLKTGKPVTFASKYRGKVVLVNLWGTFCVPCRKEMPAMEQLYRELGPKGFVIAAVSVDQGNPQVVLDFAKEFDLTFDLLHDGDGTVQQAFQTVMFPESFLVDKDGQVVKKAIGEHPWSSESNRRIVAQLLGVTLSSTAAAGVQSKAGGRVVHGSADRAGG